MGKKGGGGGSTTTVQKADPWAGQQPYLTGQGGGWHLKPGATGTPVTDKNGNVVTNSDGSIKVQYQPDDYYQAPGIAGVFSEANALYQSGQLAPNYYPGQTVADQSDWTKQALQMQANRAQNGSPLITNASNAMNNITTGQALAGNQGLNTLNQLAQEDNPYVDDLYNRANQQAQSAINGNFSAAGRYGSGAHAAASADAANNLANEMYSSLWDKRADAAASAGQLYNTGIGQQVVAGQTGQQLANQAYTDAAALSEAGGMMDDYNQQLINAAIDKYNYEQQQPLTALSNYNQLIQGSYGGTTTSTAKQNTGSPSRLGNVLGGGLSGAAAGAMIGSAIPGVGTALGATLGGIGGGLLGLF